jgi:CheY-like chemotaxis protein
VHFGTYPSAALRGGGLAVPKPVLLILVVEAEPVIQEVVNEALTGAGFDAEITSSGEEAVTLIQGDKSRYRALVTDIHLRGKLNGWEVARRAREVVPDLPVVYMTASAGHEYPAQGVPNSVLLQKPFASAQVVTAVSQLLNRIPPPHE